MPPRPIRPTIRYRSASIVPGAKRASSIQLEWLSDGEGRTVSASAALTVETSTGSCGTELVGFSFGGVVPTTDKDSTPQPAIACPLERQPPQ